LKIFDSNTFFSYARLCFNRLQLFRARLANLFSTRLQDEEQVFLAELVEMVNEGLPTDALFGTAEATAVCQVMSEADELMISDGIVYKV
jgi:DNA replication licensing factor MCM3